MTAEDSGSRTDRNWSAIAAELAALPDATLQMMLIEWKRWRSRVQTAPTMRLRRQRFEEATRFVEAIAYELTSRQPGERFRRHRRAAAAVHTIAVAPLVSLTEFRAARQDLAQFEPRRRS